MVYSYIGISWLLLVNLTILKCTYSVSRDSDTSKCNNISAADFYVVYNDNI